MRGQSELGRTVGPMGMAAFCAGCGALVPNTWSDPRGYVHVDGKVYCGPTCEPAEPMLDLDDPRIVPPG